MKLINLKQIPIRYINLQKDTLKRQAMSEMLEGHNAVRVDAHYIEDNPVLALSYSQKIALDSMSTPGLVLEDDCVKNYSQDELFVPDDADIVFLGVWKMDKPLFSAGNKIPPYEPSYGDSWYRIYSMLSSHAILYVSDRGKEIAMAAYDLAIRSGLWNDAILNRALPFIKAYAPKVPLFYQTSMLEQTNIVLEPIDSFEDIPGDFTPDDL